MSNGVQISGMKAINLACLTLIAAMLLVFPMTSHAWTCITVKVIGDDGTCDINRVAYWNYDYPGRDIVYPTGGNRCNAGQIQLDLALPRWLPGRFYTKAQCDAGRYSIEEAIGVTNSGGNWFPGGLLSVAPTNPDGYWTSIQKSALNSTSVTANLNYEERAKYTVRYSFEGSDLKVNPWTSDWIPITEQFPVDARSFGGYECVGWTEGSLAFGSTGNDCSIASVQLKPDKTGGNSIKWQYKKTWGFISVVQGGAGDSVLLSPYQESSIFYRIFGEVDVVARRILEHENGDRHRLTESYSVGWAGGPDIYDLPLLNHDADTTDNVVRRLDLQKDTLFYWRYIQESSLAVDFDPTVFVPQAVRDAAKPFPHSGKTWHKSNEQLNISIESTVFDPDTGGTWRCVGWTGTGDVEASGDDCANVPTVLLTSKSTITWTFARVYNIRVGIEGLDPAFAPDKFSPEPGNYFYTQEDVPTLSAENIIRDDNEITRYVLKGWVGTGKIPLSGEASEASENATLTEIPPFNLDENSSVRWVYEKEMGVKVGVRGLDDASLADTVECMTANYNSCIDNADILPRPDWIASSLDQVPVNYYPVGTQLTVTAKYQVSDGINTKTMGALLGSVPDNSSGQQLYNGRKAEAFTLDAPVEIWWDYGDTTLFTVGQAIPKPDDATDDKPKIEIILPANLNTQEAVNEAFFWSTAEKRLYALRPMASVRLTWTGVTQPQEALVVWPEPENQQQHIARTPANIAPDGTPLNLYENQIAYSVNDARVTNGEFNANAAGKSVLLFLNGGTDPLTTPVQVIVVNTVTLSSVAENDYDDGHNQCTIGVPISDSAHKDPEDREGYIFNGLSFYDGAGSDRAHDRSQRLGPIIPVNTASFSDTARQMLVVWYSTDAHNIGWPTSAVKYHCEWPATTEEIVIGGGLGWPAPNANTFPDGQIYYQDDPALPGYNPNDEHAMFVGNTVYALRHNFGVYGGSEPYVLLKFRSDGTWAMQVFKVVAATAEHKFVVNDFNAGLKIQPFPPLNILPPTERSSLRTGRNWYHRDHKNGHWAKAANRDGTSKIVMDWYYPLQEGFFYPDFDNDGAPDAVTGEAIPFLGHNGGGSVNPTGANGVTYNIIWPPLSPPVPQKGPPVLRLGETLITAKNDLPDMLNMASARVLFDESMYAGKGHLVKLFDPLAERRVQLDMLENLEGLDTESQDGKVFFNDLPYFLNARLFYDPVAKDLVFHGTLDSSGVGDPLLLTNVLSLSERDLLIAKLGQLARTIGALYAKTRNPNDISFQSMTVLKNPFNEELEHDVATWADKLWGLPLGIDQDDDGNPQSTTLLRATNALTAGTASGSGFVTLVENDHESLGAASVSLHVIRVGPEVYPGELKVIESTNVFDEKLTLRHSSDFGGEPENFYMEWYYRPDEDGVSPPLPIGDDVAGWLFLGSGVGMSEYTIEGADIRTLSDNWIAMRYNYRKVFPEPALDDDIDPPPRDEPYWSPWAGAPGNMQAMLAEGWLKRVVDKLNPLDARVRDFQRNETNTLVSMIAQAGAYCGGDIALNDSAENLNSVGLIAAYQTLLKRGMSLSIDARQNYGPANVALLNMATRISDLSMLLANEAYADAIDPTIGFTTASGELGSFAPATFAFQNQLATSLEEELVLLRGRDNTASTTRGCPIFNRLFWNFTNGNGEVAYVQTYNVADQDLSGVVDENDAQTMFPQGHGDAWGHYLSAMQPWYRLLANEYFTWEPRAESVLVAGVPVLIDYLDERKFAKAAAAKAKAGIEIVDLTYRSAYIDEADGQWQGYKDTDSERAWGVDEWSRRVGNGAYMDWVLVNAMLPPKDLNPEHTGIRKIDRSTVDEVNAISSYYQTAQQKIDKADAGLNPLGLARGVVPFDIDPNFLEIGSSVEGLTHFQQIYERALKALQNATKVFDFANEFTQSLRRSADNLDEFKQNLTEQETDFKNRLIEIYGYPYSDDIGPNGTYPSGYDGPDWAHFMIVERSELTGKTPAPIDNFEIDFDFSDAELDPELGITSNTFTVQYPVDTEGPWIVKDADWSGARRATGEIQDALSDYMQAESEFQRSLKELEIAVGSIDSGRQSLEQKHQIFAENILSMRTTNAEVSNLESEIELLNSFMLAARRGADVSDRIFETAIESLPKSVGTSSDVAFTFRGLLFTAKSVLASALLTTGDTLERHIQKAEHSINAVERDGDVTLSINDSRYEVAQMVSEMGTLLNSAIIKQYESFQLREAMSQSLGRYNAAVASGERLLAERAMQRKLVAADVQDYRYQDISFRIFRNDSLQKYRAQFDLAARYVYLAAMAYDYETNLLSTDSGSGSGFLSDIFRQRSLGQMVDGEPVAGLGGLSDILARLGQNFDLYESRLGFNNPQTETNRFSLRSEHFRIRGDSASDNIWKTELASHVVPNLWDNENFKRYALPFTTKESGIQKAIVIPFSTTVTFGKNFFGRKLSGGDSAYDPTNFATKVRSVGVWFEGYPLDQLSQTPRVYLVPIGADVLRAPGDDSFTTRQWNIVDQKLPAPFALGASDLANPNWIPINDSLSDDLGGIRRYPSLRAYKYTDGFDDAETTSNSRLIGRSVWNTQWLLIIPGGTLLFDPETGLDTFLNNVTDIKLFFQTYSYNGE